MSNSKCPTKDLFLHIWKATQSNHAGLPACSQPSPASSQRCLKSICSWLRVTHKPFLWQPLELASPILNSIPALQGVGRSNQPPVAAIPPEGRPNFRCWGVSLPLSFFTNCSHLRIEKFHSTGHKVSI